MDCLICKHGETMAGKVTVTLERDGMTLVIKGVPDRICENCSEAYVDEATSQLLETAEKALRAGVQVETREYIAA